MKTNTIVTASDQAYIWGVWLLIASMRKCNMNEPVLIGAYNYSPQWKADLLKFSNVKIIELSKENHQSITCIKPYIMLQAATSYVTWVDSDGIFSGNCSEYLTNNEDYIYIRQRTVGELHNLYLKQRTMYDNPNEIPPQVLAVWQHDVNQKTTPTYSNGISAALIGINKKNFDFLREWQKQIAKVLPNDVDVVDDKSIGYFQTDESVLNSLLLFSSHAPLISNKYVMDHLETPHFIHFGYNPKPWIMWNSYSIKHFKTVMTIIQWARENGFMPQEKLPFSFNAKHYFLCSHLAPLAPYIAKIRKYWKKLKKRLHQPKSR